MEAHERSRLIDYLSGFVAERRLQRFQDVLGDRIGHMCVVLENVFQAHNASAVLRSCECFGVQHVHFIENRNRMRISDDVAMGSAAWLTIHRHNAASENTSAALQDLKRQGFRIVACTPHTSDQLLTELDVSQKFALLLGTEMEGLSDEAMAMADAYVKVPMHGFTESFNVSVCAALCLYELTRRIRAGVASNGLQDDEKEEILLQWLRSSITLGDALAEDFTRKMSG